MHAHGCRSIAAPIPSHVAAELEAVRTQAAKDKSELGLLRLRLDPPDEQAASTATAAARQAAERVMEVCKAEAEEEAALSEGAAGAGSRQPVLGEGEGEPGTDHGTEGPGSRDHGTDRSDARWSLGGWVSSLKLGDVVAQALVQQVSAMLYGSSRGSSVTGDAAEQTPADGSAVGSAEPAGGDSAGGDSAGGDSADGDSAGGGAAAGVGGGPAGSDSRGRLERSFMCQLGALGSAASLHQLLSDALLLEQVRLGDQVY